MQNFGSKTAILSTVTDRSSFFARILQINGTLRLRKKEFNEYHFNGENEKKTSCRSENFWQSEDSIL
jgi:hypothetical protein